ncbi:MAG: DUF58 domain-containing protein [Caldilineae bacterium]|nr:DUF58 domain-containing protein [Anaerolineae bacterium]MCB0207110.1 DUF58 domain-containing protein [Anaerolineae bacterium]MCB0254980.1 DUF58 domain-containing protein [Anaerolineae bacterium]MCB9154399.1 DUF58 domain-containing protein [Caldilineae bacterium]
MLSNDLINKIRRIEIRTKRLVTDSFAGEYHSIFKGRGMEFEEVRPYQPGDEVRTIDWNVTARTGEVYVKRYVEERELTVMLVVDASASENFGSVQQFKRELAAELTAVLSFAATTNNDRVGLLIFTDQIELFIPPRKGRKHVLRLIRELLAFQPQGTGTDIKMALEKVNHILKRRSIIFLVSDFIADPESYRVAMATTNRRHDLIAVDLHDPLESEIGNVGLLAIEDPETGEIRWVDTGSKAWRTAFRQRVEHARAGKVRAFRQAAVDHIGIGTDQDYVAPLTAFFQERYKRLRH